VTHGIRTSKVTHMENNMLGCFRKCDSEKET